jgi:hypothetical protein
MGSLLNFIELFTENEYSDWCFYGPTNQKINKSFSKTTYPEIKDGYDNFILIEPTESFKGLTKFLESNKTVEFISFVKENDINLLISSIADPPTEENYINLVNELKKRDVYDNCYFVTSNCNIVNDKTFSFHFFLEDYVKSKNLIFNQETDLGYMSKEILIEELDEYRNKKFLCFNKTIDKQHRYSLYHDYLSNDFSDSYFSFLELEGIHCNPYQENIYELDYYLKNIPIQLDTNNNFNFTSSNTLKKELFLDSCIHLVTETSFHDNELFLSEKLIKPIINYQPFIVLGPHLYLNELKNLGFKTFSEFWDEGYDLIKNPKDRYFKLSKLILELNKKSIDEINKLYQECKEMCIFNRNHINNLEISTFDYYFNTSLNEKK